MVRKSRIPFSKMLTVGLLPSFLKIILYRAKGAKIGRHVKIGFFSVIQFKDSCTIDEYVEISPFTSIMCDNLVIGKRTHIRAFVVIQTRNIVIGKDVIISETSIIRNQLENTSSGIEIGDRVHIFPYTIIDPTCKITIGKESSVGFASYIFTHSSYKSILDGYPVEFGEVHIGKSVWLPTRVFIMPNVNIGDNAVIGTGSIVNKDIPEGVLAVGMPARVVKQREEIVKHYNEIEKKNIVKKIIEDFFSYLNYTKNTIFETFEQSGFTVYEARKPRKRGKIFRLAYVYGKICEDFTFNAVVFEKERLLMEAMENHSSDFVWFVLESKRCSERLDDISEELLEFFTRYGLIFDRP